MSRNVKQHSTEAGNKPLQIKVSLFDHDWNLFDDVEVDYRTGETPLQLKQRVLLGKHILTSEGVLVRLCKQQLCAKSTEMMVKSVSEIKPGKDYLIVGLTKVKPQIKIEPAFEVENVNWFEAVWTSPPPKADPNPFFFTPFTHYLVEDAFIPNERLRSLQTSIVEDVQAVRDLAGWITSNAFAWDRPSCLDDNSELEREQEVAATKLQQQQSGLNYSNHCSIDFHSKPVIVKDHNLRMIFEYFSKHSRNSQESSLVEVVLPSEEDDFWSDESVEENYFAQRLKASPQFCFEGRHLLFGSEAQAATHSLFQCHFPLLARCGSAAITLINQGLSLQEAVTVGVASADNCVQFFGFYLMDSSFPVRVALTRPFHLFGGSEEVIQIATWFWKAYDFATQTAALLSEHQKQKPTKSLKSPKSLKGSVDPTRTKVAFSSRHHFFKPIRNKFAALTTEQDQWSHGISSSTLLLNRMMRVYRQLSETLDCQSFIDFPLGVLTMPSYFTTSSSSERGVTTTTAEEEAVILRNHAFTESLRESLENMFQSLQSEQTVFCPLLVLPFRVWENHWPGRYYQSQCLQLLGSAIDFLNTARVDHLDLHPGNLLWQISPPGGSSQPLALKVCDFEFAVVFDEKISEGFVNYLLDARDWRYPFHRKWNSDLQQFGQARNNLYALHCLTAWTLRETERDLGYGEFMERHGERLAEEFYTPSQKEHQQHE